MTILHLSGLQIVGDGVVVGGEMEGDRDHDRELLLRE